MGVSTDAILVWGFDIGGEDTLDQEVLDRIEYLNEEYSKMMRIEKKTGSELIRHCSDEYPMYIIGFSPTMIRARRGNPAEVAQLDVDVRKAQKSIEAFAKEIGIDVQHGRWLLASDWG